jgi:hypothetical protein
MAEPRQQLRATTDAYCTAGVFERILRDSAGHNRVHSLARGRVMSLLLRLGATSPRFNRSTFSVEVERKITTAQEGATERRS